MKLLLVIYTLLIVCFGFISCKKEIIPDEPPYIEQWWDDYYGTYTVFDTANDLTYQMEIKQIARYFDGSLFRDSMNNQNIGNKFDLKILTIQNIIYLNFLDFGIIQPMFDKNGKRWTFSGALVQKDDNDTLELKYTLSNIAYYMEDGVPYYACECVDLAIKNE